MDNKSELTTRLRRQIKELKLNERFLSEARNGAESLVKHIPNLEARTQILTHWVQRDCNSYSANEIKPILNEVHRKLPVEVREKIYEPLLDLTTPFIVPQYELRQDILTFPTSFLFNTQVMGHMTSTEMKCLFIRRVPMNYRGLLKGVSLDALLDTEISPATNLCNLIRHLRVFVRYGVPDAGSTSTAADKVHDAEALKFNDPQVEPKSFSDFGSSLDPLRRIDYASGKVKIELCILGPRSTAARGALDRVTFNLIVSVKPTFDFVAAAGGEITVRLERERLGLGSDITYVIRSIVTQPDFLAQDDTIPDFAHSAWLRNRKTHPQCWEIHGPYKEPSWQHYIYGPKIDNCHCLDCSRCACGRGGHQVVLDLNDDEGDNPWPPQRGRDRLKRRNEQRRERQRLEAKAQAATQEQTSESPTTASAEKAIGAERTAEALQVRSD